MNIEEIIEYSQKFDTSDIYNIKNNGVVFTKKEICNKIIYELNPNITDKICEPSVGKGIFIFTLLEYFRNYKNISINDLVFFVENNLYCYDINKEFINELKILLKEYFLYLNFKKNINIKNIIISDFLLIENKFDIIFGNPPYIRIQNLDKLYLDKLKFIGLNSIKNGNIDLYYAFIEKSLMISDKIGFIIPNSFIKNKTGINLRNIINNNLYKIYDNENNKVWNNISTYTCIILCDNIKREYFEYITNNTIIKINKNSINWFKREQNNNIKNIIKNISGSLATLKDDIYKMDKVDDIYAYKNNYIIEKTICKKVYKATTKKEYWFIYPYDEYNKIISEEYLSQKYPLAYKYLLENKIFLNKRDSGNINKLFKYNSWYAYGRKQGFLKKLDDDDIRIILPVTFLKNNIHYKLDNDCLVLSGLSIIINKKNIEKFITIINSNEFQEYLDKTNKKLYDKNINKIWLTLSTTSLKNY